MGAIQSSEGKAQKEKDASGHPKSVSKQAMATNGMQQIILDEGLTYDEIVEHYMPPTFPMDPIVTEETVGVCRESWEHILKTDRNGTSGAIAFYFDFYERLDERTDAFKSVFGDDMAKKGNVLIMALDFLTSVDTSNLTVVDMRLRGLGETHNLKPGVRPWMYSVYAETALTTISHSLGTNATYQVMQEWTNLFSYALRRMVPHAVVGRIVPTESTQMSFADGINLAEAEKFAENHSRHGEGGTSLMGASQAGTQRQSGRLGADSSRNDGAASNITGRQTGRNNNTSRFSERKDNKDVASERSK